MRTNTIGLFTFVGLAALTVAFAEPPKKSSVLVVVDPPPKEIGRDYTEYWEIMATGKFVKDLRPLKPADSTDLREFALSLPILETRNENGIAFVYRFSKAAPDADTWTMPGDGAQEPVQIRRLEPGPGGAQRIEFKVGLWRGAPLKRYTHFAKLERRAGGWHVLDGRLLRPKGKQGGARQPATAVDSKSEGDEKAKPESKGRSR